MTDPSEHSDVLAEVNRSYLSFIARLAAKGIFIPEEYEDLARAAFHAGFNSGMGYTQARIATAFASPS